MKPETYQQLQMRCIDPIQKTYEDIRPIVLYGQTITERSEEIEQERTSLGEKAKRFVTEGMWGLADKRKTPKKPAPTSYPEPIAGYILQLKQIYPPLHYREIVRIIKRKFGYQTNHHTLKKFLEAHQLPVQLGLNLEQMTPFKTAYEKRWVIVRLFYEGWEKKSIAGVLQIARSHVYHILQLFEQDGFVGLEDKRTRPANHPHNQLSLSFLDEVATLQKEYPRLGRFRIWGLLKKKRGSNKIPSESTIGQAMAYNRVFNQAPPPWPTPPQPPSEPLPLPYQPTYPHQYWFIDLRYLIKQEQRWFYSICIIEGYSRKILAGLVSERQDLLAILRLLHPVLLEYGLPDGLVSDNAKIFKSAGYLQLLNTLNIQPCYIEGGEPWQNLIEAQFKVQTRLADYRFEQASSPTELEEQHGFFIQLFNTTDHWAHRRQPADRTTPTDMLGGILGRAVEPSLIQKAFRHLQFSRLINSRGLVSVQRFYIFAARGLTHQRVSVWIYNEELHITHQQNPLARYSCTLDTHHKRIRFLSRPTFYPTSRKHPQLELFELDEQFWKRAWQRPEYLFRSTYSPAKQLPLFMLGLLLFIVYFLLFI